MLCRISCISLTVTVIAMLIVIGTAGASAETPAGYVIMPAADSSVGGQFTAVLPDVHENAIFVLSIDNTISPGQTVHVKKTVDHFITTLNVDLKWDNPNADLSILIYSPSSGQFGPWQDGKISQRINKDIYNPGGIEQGDWEYYITNWGTEGTHYSI